MKNTGIFVGENVAGSPCFSPDRVVTRGEFMTMLVKALNISVDEKVTETGYADAPDWLKPYLAAALRSGLTLETGSGDRFWPDLPVTGEEAAGVLCAALNLTAREQSVLSAEASAPTALEIAAQNGFDLLSGDNLTRETLAQLLYQASQFQA